MSSRDNRERDRRAPAVTPRTNEYFVPKDGIDREVITADICRYLGNDALVRPGNYENPQTRQIQAGYFINAYRNLTTAMISDLKADSERWDAERRATRNPSNGIPLDANGMVRKSNTPVVEYRASTTHQSRQYYGPTETTPSSYQSQQPQPPPQDMYNSGYPSASAYNQPAPGYGGPSQGYPSQPDHYYVGGNMGVAREPERGAPVSAAGQTVPRSSYPAQPPTSYAESRGNVPSYYPAPQPSQTVPYGVQQTEPYYPRAVPATGAYGEPQDDGYDRGYPETTQYAQVPSTTATANQSARRGERERDQERDRHSSHRSRR
ncbi:hypothetical protein HYFRA_00002026 [Hymenoscyphus fraxineus]|uniref:Transcription factor RfeG n=1 Tax=Hymenoscyphus fraxineus TaxID=746836 RepID=A0A9N9KL39_9HELO|nr:hypothetical protein HYFRA_00002026 [Hymenoscyphus fraxineus]